MSAQQVRIVESRAINKTLGQTRTIARKEVKAVFNVSRKQTNTIDYKRATPSTVTGNLEADRTPVPLDYFSPKQETESGVRRIVIKGGHRINIHKEYKRARKNVAAGVSIEVFKGERKIIPYAFLIADGAPRVFARGVYRKGTQHGFIQRHQRVRSDGNDLPISPLITITAFGQVMNDPVIRTISKKALEIYPRQLENQVIFMLTTI